MNRLRSILLSGLVALLMVGVVYAEEIGQVQESEEVERSFIGTWTGSNCVDSSEWQCLHLEFTFSYDLRIAV